MAGGKQGRSKPQEIREVCRLCKGDKELKLVEKYGPRFPLTGRHSAGIPVESKVVGGGPGFLPEKGGNEEIQKVDKKLESCE